jgi:tRNA(Ile)-lysidine synthase
MPVTLPQVVADRLQNPPRRPGVVVAVSGGPDSVALLRAVLSLQLNEPILVAHLNHQLRGAESDADEEFVRQLCMKLQHEVHPNLHFEFRRAHVALLAETEKKNLEAVARRERYRFLADVAEKYQIGCILTGHTADDQAETVLLRLIRGCGLRGLRGIPPRRQLSPDLEVRRPLLTIRRDEVLEFLRQLGQDYRCDSSNRDPRLLRNRVRQELIPLLQTRFHPRVANQLVQLAEQAASHYRLLRRRARRILRASEQPPAGPLRILDLRRLRSVSELEGCEALRLLWRRQGWPLDPIGRRGWQRIWSVVMGRIAALDAPGGIHIRRRERVLQVGPKLHS